MRETAYITAVARIRANENNLLTSADLDRFLSAKDIKELDSFLSDKGYGASEQEDMFQTETRKAWQLIQEVAPDFHEFYPLYARFDFHNLKAVLKGTVTGVDYEKLLLFPSSVSIADLKTAVGERKFSLLPSSMEKPAKAAYDALTHNGDGQYADLLLDRAYLDSLISFAERQKVSFLSEFCELTVAAADLRIAARAATLNKGQQFMEQAISPCHTLEKKELISAALMGITALEEALRQSAYPEAAEALKRSLSQLEKWCDNSTAVYVRKAKYDSFGIGPLYQYLVNKTAEISSVKVIYTGKRAKLSEETIRSYLRCLS